MNAQSTSTATANARGTRRIVYDDAISRWFVTASLGWGVVALLLGAIIALQLAFFQANLPPWLSFGRLRPLHTNAAIFAFVGNRMFAGVYYSTQRLVKARLFSDALSKFHFWGWQLIIVSAALTLPFGITEGKEYAELAWPIDLAIAVVWVAFAINFFGTLWRRNEKHLYVAIWFYISTVVTVAVLHIVNSLALPTSPLHSYSVFAGAQDALVQWWYGHNAVAFFLTTPILGIMYYFLPKAANRPVYSYRLSVVHFWALVFIYIWAGPHHLLNTALPDWAQTLGMIFSVMLWAPSWGGMINGLLTLRGAWDKLREDPVLKFLAAGVTFYGMATFEGPLLSIKSVSALAHYTDWIIGHVHSGALGWNGFMAAGMFYWMVPRLYGTELHSKRLADLHFWLGTLGILLYVVSMWFSGVTQGLMLQGVNANGSLTYPSFVETLIAIKPMYWVRLVGGTMYLVGHVLMVYNLWVTARSGKPVEVSIEVPEPEAEGAPIPWTRIVFGPPVVVSAVVLAVLGLVTLSDGLGGIAFLVVAAVIGVGAVFILNLRKRTDDERWHHWLEGRALLFTVLTVIAVLIGGVAEIVPALVIKPAEGSPSAQLPYSALELEGRDLYVREGCYVCHSQMIRPFRHEALRYGAVSELGDSRYDHPFQWGSRRTGPDLAREGGKYPNLWHLEHLKNPRNISPGSNMPPYAFLAEAKVDYARTADKVRAMRTLGVPYTDAEVTGASDAARAQADGLAKDLAANGAGIAPDSEMVALISYLQRVGRGPRPLAAAAVPTPAVKPASP